MGDLPSPHICYDQTDIDTRITSLQHHFKKSTSTQIPNNCTSTIELLPAESPRNCDEGLCRASSRLWHDAVHRFLAHSEVRRSVRLLRHAKSETKMNSIIMMI